MELLPPEQAVPSNPRWHELRRAGVTASEIAAVLGISPFESPFSLYWRKREGWELEETPEMVAGRLAEPVIAQWFAEACDPLENLAVRPAGLYASEARPWQLATPDRLIHLACPGCDPPDAWCDCRGTGVAEPAHAALECKYVIEGWTLGGWGEPDTDQVPVHYRAQCLWQLDVLGLDEVFLAAWHGAEFRPYRIRRDEKDLRVMRDAALRFLHRLEVDDPPALDDHTATVWALKKLHPSMVDKEVDAPVEFAEGYRRARQLAARADAMKRRYEARARQLLGDGSRLMCNGHLVCSRSVFDQSGELAELDSLDADPPTVDRLNPGRAASYLTPKGTR